jgi:hypothetical protein
MFTQLLRSLSPSDQADLEVVLGLSFVVRGKGAPLYDPVALLALWNALATDGVPRKFTVAEAQQWINSAPRGIAKPVIKAAIVISTDVALNTASGPVTADTDDRTMLLILCFFLAFCHDVHSVTIVQSARKKGQGTKDATTPEDVVQWMRARVADFGAATGDGHVACAFTVHGVTVRVFQQQTQTTLSPMEKLCAEKLAEESVQHRELMVANAAIHGHLEAVRVEAPLYFAGCGPIDVPLALFLARHARGYMISFDSGVNGGYTEQFIEQHSHCGGPVLDLLGTMINVGPSVTRELATPPGILALNDDAAGIADVARNTTKVFGKPLNKVPAGPGADAVGMTTMNFRISCSNFTSCFGSAFVELLVAKSDEPFATAYPYAPRFALTLVSNALLAHGAPLDRALISACIHDPASGRAALAEIAMPPSLARELASNIPGIATVAGLYSFIALGTDARLGAVMAEWDSIARLGLPELAGMQGPAVSSALPNLADSGALVLPMPF